MLHIHISIFLSIFRLFFISIINFLNLLTLENDLNKPSYIFYRAHKGFFFGLLYYLRL